VDKRKILIQLDTDAQPSVFDRVVAIDAGADQVFSYGAVQPEQVRELVHGAIFTRGPKDLQSTCIFIGGSNVALAEELLAEVQRHLLPQYGLSVSIMLDANGANTTAAAAVFTASGHLDLKGCKALVLGATGPVGQRIVRLLARAGAAVCAGSRQESRAEEVCRNIRLRMPDAKLAPAATGTRDELNQALQGQDLVIAAGTPGAILLPRSARQDNRDLRLLVDLNAVPPAGIEEVEAGDKGKERGGIICYGAIGVGGTKMKLHKLAIACMFQRNNQVLDAEEIYALTATLKG
jgi:methylenetetrahydrofolate/methylenetetrahydromethanopterin dehydrogenase (NADP+)